MSVLLSRTMLKVQDYGNWLDDDVQSVNELLGRNTFIGSVIQNSGCSDKEVQCFKCLGLACGVRISTWVLYLALPVFL